MGNSIQLEPAVNPLIVAGNEEVSLPIDPPRPTLLPRVQVDGKLFQRGVKRFSVNGVTYGPFAPNALGEQFPNLEQVHADFALMQEAAINSIRTYHLPPAWLLDAAAEQEMSVMIDIPWAKHLCFLDSPQVQADARAAVRQAVLAGRDFPSVFAYSVGNEIPANIVRWHGSRRIERFIAELVDVAKQADPQALATYANYPSTEYLDLSACDFVTFNVYLHDREVFRRYLLRLQNIVGEKPLLLGELGMDTYRHGSEWQAEFLAGHLCEAKRMGLAGSFVFAWSDDWHTGGFQVENWAFGITDRNRNPKPAFEAVGKAYGCSLNSLLTDPPKVSVVVCTYNGGSTLQKCVESLEKIDYPDYEVIVVDDGSTDQTQEILQGFSNVKVIRQANLGLSAARNVGLYAASGSIIAYTDSDCFVDRDWLTLLVAQLEQTGAEAVGGPNLIPEGGQAATCVGASPGQPTHVLESDQVAEHIPGCNMAIRRDALLAINGFDIQYRKAGDDVDICWRLKQAGYWITFAPGAFVWHQRRQTPYAYLKQQAGYGEAEALLRFQHPDRFTDRGDGKWNGVLYGASLRGLRIEAPIIYRGTFGTGLFQCIYQPQPAHWVMLPSTLEWHLVIGICLLAIPAWSGAAVLAAVLWSLSVVVAGLQALQAKIPAKHDNWSSRGLVMFLCYAQPLVRSWFRQKTRLFNYQRPTDAQLLPPTGNRTSSPLRALARYWCEDAIIDRTHLLGKLAAVLQDRHWSKSVDKGWESWDLEVYCHPWSMARISTAQEEHGQGKRLIKVRCQVVPSGYTRVVLGLAFAFVAMGALFWSWPYLVIATFLGIAGCALYWRGMWRAASVMSLVDEIAHQLGFIDCDSEIPR